MANPSTNRQVTLSVLLITFNQEPYIRQCLESILMQHVEFEVELVVADDCSTDTTPKIIQGLLHESRLPYRILHSTSNVGRMKNTERGLAACQGEYIAIMEGDDFWLDPKRLLKHVAFLDANPSCVMTFNRTTLLDETGGVRRAQQQEPGRAYELITTAMLAERNRIGNLSSCVIRKSAFEKLIPDIYEYEFADWMLGMALGEHGTIAKLNEPMSSYRIHQKGLWSQERDKEIAILSVIDRHDQFLGYRYHREFMIHKDRLRRKIRNRRICAMLPAWAPRIAKAIWRKPCGH